jgi:hypothetical protein
MCGMSMDVCCRARHVDLSKNALTGDYPSNFSSFAPERLVHLDISSNYFTGIPVELRTLKTLSYAVSLQWHPSRDASEVHNAVCGEWGGGRRG